MTADKFSNKAEAFEAFDDTPLSPQAGETIGAVIARRYNRRDMLKGSLGVTAATVLFGEVALIGASGPAKAASAGFAFREVTAEVDQKHRVAEGYDADIVIAWGDPLFEGLEPFDAKTLTAEGQAKRFGYNNDFIAFFPLNPQGTRALLCVNHEYASPEVMFAGIGGRPDRNDFAKITAAHADVEMAAHGVGIVEIAAQDQGRSPGAQDPGHAQQLCRRPDPVGHLPHRRGEFPRLFLDRREGHRRQAQEDGPRRVAATELRPLRRARQLVQLGALS